MADKPSVIRQTDDPARKLARVLLRSARYAALAVHEPDTGFPSVSRVLIGSDIDGAAVILVSGLSAHTRALDQDARVSLLVGEPGKGDPLAHPRLTAQCLAEPVAAGGLVHQRLRKRFLARHPKSALYIDFGDFRFFRLPVQTAALNGGFGRAYHLPGSDFAISLPALGDTAAVNAAADALLDLVMLQPVEAGAIAMAHCGAKSAKWRYCGADMAGIDLIHGDSLLRYEFATPLERAGDIIFVLSNTEYPIP
ncbi:MAG: HugZ family protein [Allorhizobium sp.]